MTDLTNDPASRAAHGDPVIDATKIPPPLEERAHWGRRTAAWLLQFALFVVVVSGTLMFLDGSVPDSDAEFTVLDPVGPVFMLLITVGATLIWPGQTLGMRVVGIKVVGEDGEPLSFGRAVVRFVACSVIFLIPVLMLVEWLTPLGQGRRSLRDRMAKTWVVRDEHHAIPRWVPVALAVGSLVLVAGSMVASWNSVGDEDRDEFVTWCRDAGGGTAAECGCHYDWVMDRFADEPASVASLMDEDGIFRKDAYAKVGVVTGVCKKGPDR